jgi:hypothetical protein
MLSTLFAVNWQPELRGIVVVLIVPSVNEVLTIKVLKGGIAIEDFIKERMHKLY